MHAALPLLLLLPGALAGCASVAGPDGAVTLERRVGAMGTWLSIEVTAVDRPRALLASEGAVRAIEAVERRLSTWGEDSELARLNRAPVGTPFALSAELARELERVRELWQATGGAFDPGVGALVQAWGLRTGGRRPAPAEIEAALAPGGMAALELRDGLAVRRHAALSLEEGGFGKGVGLDAALRELRAAGVEHAVLDLGGQLALCGERRSASWALADPANRERGVLELTLEGGSLATSGSSERGIVVDGEHLSHVLDPRTGYPARDFGTVTVWAADATTADALSTGLFVMGPDEALRWAEAHEGVEVVVLDYVDGALRARASAGWRGRLRPLVAGLTVSFTESGNERSFGE